MQQDNVQHKEVNEPRKKYTYKDCLRGDVPVPSKVNGAAMFQILMVGGMVAFMVSINGIRNTGFDFLVQSHWLYPLMFCIAFLTRTFIGQPLFMLLMPHLIEGRFQSYAKSIATTALNVLIMGPVMAAIATFLLVGVDDYFYHYITTIPITMPIAFFVSHFIVGPISKLIFNNHIKPADGMSALITLRENTSSIARFLGF